MSRKSLNLVDLFIIYKKNLRYAWYFIALAVLSSLIFILVNSSYLKGKFDIDANISIKSPLENLEVVNLLGINKLVVTKDGSTSLTSVNENINEYYVITKEYLKIAFNEASNHTEFLDYDFKINNVDDEILNIKIIGVEDIKIVNNKLKSFVNMLNTRIIGLILYNVNYEDNYLKNMVNASIGEDNASIGEDKERNDKLSSFLNDAKALGVDVESPEFLKMWMMNAYNERNNELLLIQMRSLMTKDIKTEELELFEIDSSKITSQDLPLKKIISIIFLLSFVLYSLFIVTFR